MLAEKGKVFKVKGLLKLDTTGKIFLLGIVIIAAFIGVTLGYMLPSVQDSLRNQYLLVSGILAVACLALIFFVTRNILKNMKRFAVIASRRIE